MRIKNSKGNTIIEILISSVLVGLVLTAIASMMTASIQNSAESEYRAMALRLAQDSMEIFRNDKNSIPWDTFVTYPAAGNGVWCYPNGALTTNPVITGAWTSLNNDIANINGSCGSVSVTGNNMTFNRAVQKTVSSSPPSETITVYVYWNIGIPGKTRNTKIQQTFYKTP